MLVQLRIAFYLRGEDEGDLTPAASLLVEREIPLDEAAVHSYFVILSKMTFRLDHFDARVISVEEGNLQLSGSVFCLEKDYERERDRTISLVERHRWRVVHLMDNLAEVNVVAPPDMKISSFGQLKAAGTHEWDPNKDPAIINVFQSSGWACLSCGSTNTWRTGAEQAACQDCETHFSIEEKDG